MAKGMSAAARRKISMAQKRRWAAYRAAKGKGGPAVSQGSNRSKKAGRRGRPRKTSNNPYLDMSISQLAEARRHMNEILAQVQDLFG